MKKKKNGTSNPQVRITTTGKMANYISYATSLFQDKGLDVVVLKAMGKAINKTVTAGEVERMRMDEGRCSALQDASERCAFVRGTTKNVQERRNAVGGDPTGRISEP